MKNILSIFMLFVMLAVGIVPTVGVHFCGKKLCSVKVLSKQNENGCCAKAVSNIETNKQYSVIGKVCCQTHNIQMVTDTYHLPERNTSVAPLYTLLQADWITANYTSSLVEVDATTLAKEHFPPDGFDAKNENILGFVCILRL